MAYTISNPIQGMLPIAATDSGILSPYQVESGGSTYIPTPPLSLGMIVRAVDPTYGMGEFILLAGVASTAVGSLVIWDGTTYATTLCPVTANMGRPVAVAMSANTSATTYGWYQISGTAVVKKSTGITIAPTTTLGINSIGKIGASASGKQILNARTANAATVASATTTVAVLIDRPFSQGRVS